MITWLTKSFYWIIGLIGLLAISASPAISQKPNILFIMSDDHAAQAIGAYESHLARLNPTPILDKLAHEGILFTNCFVTNSICTPSRACILTGQYSHTTGILDLEDQLDQSKHNLLETKRHY
jgi:arylsulfatase A-like enzyme